MYLSPYIVKKSPNSKEHQAQSTLGARGSFFRSEAFFFLARISIAASIRRSIAASLQNKSPLAPREGAKRQSHTLSHAVKLFNVLNKTAPFIFPPTPLIQLWSITGSVSQII